MRAPSLALAAILSLAAAPAALAQADANTVSVQYAGSMGAVMDKGIGPAFTAKTGTAVQGQGQGALGIAHLIVAKSIAPDVFVSISPAPIKVVQAAGLGGKGVPVASTQIVLAYAAKSSFADAIKKDGVKALAAPGLRLGRTDPATDPLGQYSLFTLQLAASRYKMPDLVQKVAGATENPDQIFSEPSILARLAAGQIDASFAYEAFAISQHVQFVTLPDTLNFSNPADQADYNKASLTLTVKGKTVTAKPGPLVYYAMVLKDAPHPAAAKAFVAFLNSAQGQKILKDYGYNAPKGGSI